MMENKSAQFPLLSKSVLSRPSSGILSERAHHVESFSNTRWRLSRRGEKQMEKLDRITTDPARMNGEPRIRAGSVVIRSSFSICFSPLLDRRQRVFEKLST